MTVTFYTGVTKYTNGDKSFSVKNHPTLRGVLEELGGYYGDGLIAFLNGSETCLILINGKGIKLTGGFDSPLEQSDIIEILPFVDAG